MKSLCDKKRRKCNLNRVSQKKFALTLERITNNLIIFRR